MERKRASKKHAASGKSQIASADHASRITRHVSRINTNISARYTDKIKPSLLKEAAQAALDQQHARGRVELTIAITGDAQLRALNLTFRKINKPTDVLSFGLESSEGLDSSAERNYLGDVIISYPMARAQAKAGGHPIEAELQLLVVHGVLHLLGHDHYKPKEKAKMWNAQSKILKLIGSAISGPAETD